MAARIQPPGSHGRARRAQQAASRLKPATGAVKSLQEGVGSGSIRLASSTRPLPARLARSMAWSALASRSEGSTPSWGASATPMLVPTRARPPPGSVTGACTASLSRFTISRHSAGSTSMVNSTTNSSPPIRPAVSLARKHDCRRRPISTSSASPASWPWRSLTCLNPSRSR